MASMPTTTVDALVVGAGPTGLTLAGELICFGLSVKVIDQALTPPVDHSRALGIHARTLEVFEQIGIVDEVHKRDVSFTTLNIISSRGRRGSVPLTALRELDTPYPEMLGLPQQQTEALLLERLQGLGGAVQRGVQLTSYTQDADGVTACLRDAEGAEQTVRAGWLLGCDGTKSSVRRGADISFDGDTYPELCMVGDATVEWPLPSRGLCVMPSRHGVVAAFPEPGTDNFRVVIVVPREDIATTRELSAADFERYLKQMLPVPFRMTSARHLSRYRLHHRMASRFHAGRVFLAGDAAHVHSPVGGQGMNTGIQDAFNLGWKLAGVAKGVLPAWVLDTYEEERRRVAAKLVGFTDRLFGALTSRGWLAMFLRVLYPEVMVYVMRVPFMQRRLMGFFSQLHINYARSRLSTQCSPDAPTTDAPAIDAPATNGQATTDPAKNGAPATNGAAAKTGLTSFWKPAGSAARAGWRAPDVLLPGAGGGCDAAPARLYELLRGMHHTLLAFCERGDDEIAREAAALQARLGDRLRVVRVRRRGPEPSNPKHGSNQALTNGHAAAGPAPVDCVDADGKAHTRYGVSAPCGFLIRPDGYIGVAHAPAGVLVEEVSRRFTV